MNDGSTGVQPMDTTTTTSANDFPERPSTADGRSDPDDDGVTAPPSNGLSCDGIIDPGDPNPASSTVGDDGSAADENAKDEEEARKAIDMLRGSDVAARVAAARQLVAIAAVLGERRVREELLPFLTETVDDEDEVLVAIASELGKLVPHVGGPTQAHLLLPPLELLLTVEESAVRENAVESTRAVAEILPDESFHGEYAEMVSNLATKEWFTARMSACGLIACGFSRFTSERQDAQLLQFASLCRDDAPMVRRVASQYLGLLLVNIIQSRGPSSVSPNGMVTTTVLPLYEELASNDQDSVRLQTADNCILFGKAMGSLPRRDSLEIRRDNDSEGLTMNQDGGSIIIERILPLIVATIDDRSWRVRWTAASRYAEVISAFENIPGAADSLIPAYEKLIQDHEAEVRTAATFNLGEVAKCKSLVRPPQPARGNDAMDELSDDPEKPNRITVAERLVGKVTVLTEDENEHVRAALAMVVTELAPLLGKESTITHLVPPVLLLLRDAASEVRLNLISSLSPLNEVIGVDLLSQSLLPAILDLAEDGKWRIRLAIIQHIPLLAKQLGEQFFSEQLCSLCVGWLADDISSIRHAAAANLKELTILFGAEWASAQLLPSVSDIRRHASYLRRLVAVQTCAMMAAAVNTDMAQTELLPMVLEMAYDDVPNIRFNVAKALQSMFPLCTSTVCELQIRPILSVLVEDPDRDVRYFAENAMEALDKGCVNQL